MVCTACASQWRSNRQKIIYDANPTIDNRELMCESDSAERDSDRRGAPIREGGSSLRVRLPIPQLGRARGAHDAIFAFYSFDIANAVKFSCSPPGPQCADSPRDVSRRRRSVCGRPWGGRQATRRVCVRGQVARMPSTAVTQRSFVARGHVGSS